ncbi:MAG: T9SS type A sorting domain-containing protein, partial [Bacteroidetes bacterium]|nr:T9SS type A sorting domain-containing protein [Bacteroidota bacterium]
AEITPMGFGDLIFDNGDTSYKYNGYTIRQISQIVDNFLSYFRNYTGIDWARLDTMLTKINNAFRGPYAQVSQSPLMISGAALIDTIPFLKKNTLAKQIRLEFKPEIIENIPEEFVLYQNYPNPFNPTTTIEFDLPEDAIVTLKIYNILGQETETLIDEEVYLSGKNNILFNAQAYASGVYFYRLYAKTLESESKNIYVDSKKMIILK